jgi:hypothetical protein
VFDGDMDVSGRDVDFCNGDGVPVVGTWISVLGTRISMTRTWIPVMGT